MSTPNRFLAFLSNATIAEIEVKAAAGRGGVKKQWNPAEDFMGIRVWKDGSIFPSEILVSTLNLGYPKAVITVDNSTTTEEEPVASTEAPEEGATQEETKATKVKRTYEFPDGEGNGLDIFDSNMWGQYKGTERFIAVAVVPKNLPKVDLFAEARYNDDGTPKVSVLEQGSATFGKESLLPMLKAVYNIEPNEEGFIDMEIGVSPEANLKGLCPSGNFLVPTVVARGKDKGKPDYAVRENIDVYGMMPAEVATTEATPTLEPSQDTSPVA